MDFDWWMVTRAQHLFYLVFIFDYAKMYFKLDSTKNEKEKVMVQCMRQQFVSVVIGAASRTLFNSFPFLTLLLEAIAMFLVREYSCVSRCDLRPKPKLDPT